MDAFDATFSDLDSAPAAPTPAPTPTPEPLPEPTKPKDPETGKFVKAEPKPEVKPEPTKEPEKPTESPKPSSEFEPPQVAKPSELRAYAKKMGGRAQVAEQRVSQLNSRVKALESQTQPNGDTKALTEELANTKKRLEEYEGELKVTRYERSGEYKDKYEKPYQNAVKNAWSEVQELLVSVPNPSDPDNPTERQATAQDFDEVYSLPLGQATKLAKQKFGDAASIVIQHVKAVKDAKRTALEAIQQNSGKAAEFEQQQTAQQKMAEEGRNRMFGDAVASITDKYKELFGQRDDDPKWNESLSKGRAMADLAFSNRSSLTPVQSTVLDAQIYARISGFPALRSERDTLKSQVADLQKEIAELRGSSPGKTAPGAAKVESADLTMDQAFDKFVP